MADEQSTEILRELRRIRMTLLGLFVGLALMFMAQSLHYWSESHYAVSSMGPGGPDMSGIQAQLQQIHNDLAQRGAVQLAPPIIGPQPPPIIGPQANPARGAAPMPAEKE